MTIRPRRAAAVLAAVLLPTSQVAAAPAMSPARRLPATHCQAGSGQRRRRVLTGAVAMLVALLLAWPVPATAQEEPSGSDEIWAAFQADRADLYRQLAPPIVECFQRRDSVYDPLSPIFHGCLDWHSAVHAAYSHFVLFRRLEDATYRDAVEAKIAPAGVSLIPAEQVYQQAKGQQLPLSENPYGFGWFLLLAREREEATGQTDMRDMAAYAVGKLIEWFEEQIADGSAPDHIRDYYHANYSWSLINLDAWAKYTGDAELQARVREFSQPLLSPALDSCLASDDTNPKAFGFQPVCLMRLAAVSQIWGDHATAWVAERVPEDLYVPPITEPRNCHNGGLNFTRSFALYQLYEATGDTDLRDNYVEIVRYHVSRPDLYIDPDYLGEPGYRCYSHWVAQFGVRTISRSYDPPGTTPDVPSPF